MKTSEHNEFIESTPDALLESMSHIIPRSPAIEDYALGVIMDLQSCAEDADSTESLVIELMPPVPYTVPADDEYRAGLLSEFYLARLAEDVTGTADEIIDSNAFMLVLLISSWVIEYVEGNLS